MKKSCLKTVLAFLFLLTATALPSFAQNGSRIDFTAPFPFMVGNVVLPAGTYHIATNPDDSAMFVTNSSGLSSAVSLAYPAHTTNLASKTSVGFVRRGDHYFLHSVGMESGSTYELAARSEDSKKMVAK